MRIGECSAVGKGERVRLTESLTLEVSAKKTRKNEMIIERKMK